MFGNRLTHTLDRLRNFGPYLAIELLLPGGTLVALLLWLSRRFLRNGLRDIRQYRFAPLSARVAINAKPHAGRKDLCMCPAHAVVFSAGLQRFRQWCPPRRIAAGCCA